MNRRRSHTALVIGALLIAISLPSLADVVSFVDPGLEATIRETIGKPHGDIHETDLIELTELSANGRNIVNLEGIEHCVRLAHLELAFNEIVDIIALSGLTNLSTLDLDGNQIIYISPLAGVPNLVSGIFGVDTFMVMSEDSSVPVVSGGDVEEYVLDLELLRSIAGVRVAAALRERMGFVQVQPDADGNILQGFLPVMGLSPEMATEFESFAGKLTVLPGGRLFVPGEVEVAVLDFEIAQRFGVGVGDMLLVAGDRSTELNLTIIGIMTPLEEDKESSGSRFGMQFSAGSDGKTIIVPYETMDLLWEPADDVLVTLVRTEPGYNVDEVGDAAEEALNARGSKISAVTYTDIILLSGLTNLTSLSLGNNQIVDISPLSSLTSLKSLSLGHNQIVDISALSGLFDLEWLSLDGNPIASIQPLVDNTGLGQGDQVRLDCVDLTPGSPSTLAIETLRDRGARVEFVPQDCEGN